jgi:DNA-binding beta-propeller fold protein YncE
MARTKRVVLLLAVLIGGCGALMRQAARAPQNWTVPLGPTPVALAVAPRSGRLVIADSTDQTVRLLDTRSRALLATTSIGHTPVALAVDERAGRVFALNGCMISVLNPEQVCPQGASTLSILALRHDTLTLLSTLSLGASGQNTGAAALAVDERAGRVFVATYGATTVSMLAVSSARLLGTLTLRGMFQAMALDATLHHLFISVWTSAGGGSSVDMFDSRSDALLHTARVGPGVATTILCDARAARVLVYSAGDLYVLDTRTGRMLRRRTGSGVPLAIDERDAHAMVSDEGHLRLIATNDGTPVGTVMVRGTLDVQAVGVDERAGRFYVATDRSLLVLDGRTARVRHVLALSAPPVALAADAIAHRVFILNSTAAAWSSPDSAPPLLRWLWRTLPWLPIRVPPPTAAGGTLTALDTTRL